MQACRHTFVGLATSPSAAVLLTASVSDGSVRVNVGDSNFNIPIINHVPWLQGLFGGDSLTLGKRGLNAQAPEIEIGFLQRVSRYGIQMRGGDRYYPDRLMVVCAGRHTCFGLSTCSLAASLLTTCTTSHTHTHTHTHTAYAHAIDTQEVLN